MKEVTVHGITIKYRETMNLVKDDYRMVFLTAGFDDIHCVIDFNYENGRFKNINIKPRFNIDITVEEGVYIFDVNYAGE
ncbi:hypothetical protein [Macrococcus bovicus]|uniref:Uncharacterized protein n=1 Tax=Macrococcus bovicus TaxID=69968 RepID=A0A4V3BFB9_9STAP|nr:hypothetical protein [Macrococcus bovicus]TDM13430.1 hypothetical protein ERX55_09275 [Macrococcus bovicus]